MSDDVKPWITITPKLMGKVAVSTMLMAMGMYYLTTGRRDANTSRMFTGAFLTLASVFLFVL